MTVTINEIKKLLIFYFSPINLRYDTYLKHLIGSHYDESIEVVKLLKFNKIKALTSNRNDIILALEETTIFKLNEEKTGFRLSAEYINKNFKLSDDEVKILHEFQDKCTLYLTNFHSEPPGSSLEVDDLITCFTYFGDVAYASKVKSPSSGSRDDASVVQSGFVVFRRPDSVAEVFAFLDSGLGLKHYLRQRQKRYPSSNVDSSSRPDEVFKPCSRAQNKRSLTSVEAPTNCKKLLTLAHNDPKRKTLDALTSKISSNCDENSKLVTLSTPKKRARDRVTNLNNPKRLTLDGPTAEISGKMKNSLINSDDALVEISSERYPLVSEKCLKSPVSNKSSSKSILKRLTLNIATPNETALKKVCLNGYKDLEKYREIIPEKRRQSEKNSDSSEAKIDKDSDLEIGKNKDCINPEKRLCSSLTKIVSTKNHASEIETTQKMDSNRKNRHHKRTGKSLATAIKILRSATIMTKSAWVEEGNHQSKTFSMGCVVKSVKNFMKQKDVTKDSTSAKSQFLDHNFAPNYHTLALYNCTGRSLVNEEELKEQLNSMGIRDFKIKLVPGIEPANARPSHRQPLAFITTPSSLERDNILKLHWFNFSFRPIESSPMKNSHKTIRKSLKDHVKNRQSFRQKHGRNRRLRRTANFITRKRSPTQNLESVRKS